MVKATFPVRNGIAALNVHGESCQYCLACDSGVGCG